MSYELMRIAQEECIRRNVMRIKAKAKRRFVANRIVEIAMEIVVFLIVFVLVGLVGFYCD